MVKANFESSRGIISLDAIDKEDYCEMALLKSEAYSHLIVVVFFSNKNAIQFQFRRIIRIERTTETHYLYTVI